MHIIGVLALAALGVYLVMREQKAADRRRKSWEARKPVDPEWMNIRLKRSRVK